MTLGILLSSICFKSSTKLTIFNDDDKYFVDTKYWLNVREHLNYYVKWFTIRMDSDEVHIEIQKEK